MAGLAASFREKGKNVFVSDNNVHLILVRDSPPAVEAACGRPGPLER